MAKCLFTNCDQKAEVKMTWLRSNERKDRDGGNMCGAHAAMTWTNLQNNFAHVADTLICEEVDGD